MPQKQLALRRPRNDWLGHGTITLLFGVSQIFFQTKAATGLLILAAFAVASWQIFVGRWSVRRSTPRSVGDGWGVLAAALGGMACAPVTWALARAFRSRHLEPFKLSYTTALFAAHWKVGLAAVLGSVLQSLLVLLLHEDAVSLGRGMLGYSGVLVAIAMAAVFLKGTWQPWAMAVVGTVLACLFTLLVQDLHGVYTWPYVITTWVLLVISRFIPGLKRA